MQNRWIRKIGSLLAALIWTFGLLSGTGFAQTDAELEATIDRLLMRDHESAPDLRALPPRSVVVMTKMLRDLPVPESPPRPEFYKAMGILLMEHEPVLPQAELRDALEVLVAKRDSPNESIQFSNELVLKYISSNARIRRQLDGLGVVIPVEGAPVPVHEEGDWLIPLVAMIGVLLIVGMLIGIRMYQAKRDRNESESPKPR